MGRHSTNGEFEDRENAVIEHWSGTFSIQDLERLQIYGQSRRSTFDAPIGRPPKRVRGQMWAWCRTSFKINRASNTGIRLSTGTEELIIPVLLGKGIYDSLDLRAPKPENREQPFVEEDTDKESLELYGDINELLEDFLWNYVIVPFDGKGRTQ